MDSGCSKNLLCFLTEHINERADARHRDLNVMGRVCVCVRACVHLRPHESACISVCLHVARRPAQLSPSTEVAGVPVSPIRAGFYVASSS